MYCNCASLVDLIKLLWVERSHTVSMIVMVQKESVIGSEFIFGLLSHLMYVKCAVRMLTSILIKVWEGSVTVPSSIPISYLLVLSPVKNEQVHTDGDSCSCFMKLHEEFVKEGTFAVVFFSLLSFHKSKMFWLLRIPCYVCICVNS